MLGGEAHYGVHVASFAYASASLYTSQIQIPKFLTWLIVS